MNFIFYSGNDKVCAIEGEAQYRKKDPGPQHKYNLDQKILSKRPKTPFYVKMSKSCGRINEKAKKPEKTPGPATYQTSKAYERTHMYHKPVNTATLSGFGVHQGNSVGTSDKMKLKCNRFLDVVSKNGKKTPGPG